MARFRILFLAFLLIGARQLKAYSVQTHELLIDLNWKSTIRPFLLARFPRATEAQLERAHAFAYGGCAIQDLGYYRSAITSSVISRIMFAPEISSSVCFAMPEIRMNLPLQLGRCPTTSATPPVTGWRSTRR